MKSSILAFCLFLTFSTNGQTKGEDFHLDNEYKINPTGTIKLNASDAKVYITGSNRSTAHVKIDREVTTKGLVFGHEEFNVEVSEDNGNLEIREHSNSVSVGVVGYHYEKYIIRIEAPVGISLKVKADDGDYWIRNIDGAISLDLDDADVELLECSGDKFDFRMDDGEIKMDQGRGNLDIDADDTDIEIRNANFSSVHANLDDGDLVIETSLADDGEYFIEAQDGLISFAVTKGGGKFDIRHDDGHVSTAGAFTIEEDSENRTRLALASGSAKVSIRADDARVRLASR